MRGIQFVDGADERRYNAISPIPRRNTHTTAVPQFSDGKLYGCIIDFAVLVQDHIYRQGAFVRVGGSFGMMSAGNNVAVMLKVIVHDFDSATMQLSPSPPFSAYIVSGTTTSQPFFVAKYPSDTPGGLFSIFKLDGAGPILLDGIAEEKKSSHSTVAKAARTCRWRSTLPSRIPQTTAARPFHQKHRRSSCLAQRHC